VQGHAAIIKIFDHMFIKSRRAKVVVSHSLLQDDDAFLVWDFLFYFKGDKTTLQKIRGSTTCASHLNTSFPITATTGCRRRTV